MTMHEPEIHSPGSLAFYVVKAATPYRNNIVISLFLKGRPLDKGFHIRDLMITSSGRFADPGLRLVCDIAYRSAEICPPCESALLPGPYLRLIC